LVIIYIIQINYKSQLFILLIHSYMKGVLREYFE
jgi:hypothetical protein